MFLLNTLQFTCGISTLIQRVEKFFRLPINSIYFFVVFLRADGRIFGLKFKSFR